MKRTFEIALSVLGIIASLVMVGTGIVFLYLTKSEKFLQYLEEGWSESENAYTLEQLGQAGTMFITPGLIGIALGLCAVWLLKGNRNAAVAGWGLIIVSVALCFVSLFAAIPGLFYIAAGILALARKPKLKMSKALR
ncbi:Putative uncharacterized protein [Thermobacillus xylanilyticus]|jgi:hypothetical protein|uniref:DUF4064 domain-containing protein n=2 Tax=Thermobacillus TaxID=76632 RepID=L0EGZ3_THECK|nr:MULTISPECIES: DUF4064 domain-containing protein [Thermobacillus]AGA59538.1 hypothetical protein Theco_3499 [Thermobacillus composti KWC4]CAG5089803.1 Putative uncharacterized protein [Thermobacillus xylanilyticus]